MSTDIQDRKSRPIEIIEGKVLKLHKVLRKTLIGKETQELMKTLQLFQSYIRTKGTSPKGPLIALTAPKNDEITKTKTIIMCQLTSEPRSLDFSYSYEEELRVENCLYARFIGEQNYLNMAYSKMIVYAYENYLDLTGYTYTVFVKSGDENGLLTCDVFAEVKSE